MTSKEIIHESVERNELRGSAEVDSNSKTRL